MKLLDVEAKPQNSCTCLRRHHRRDRRGRLLLKRATWWPHCCFCDISRSLHVQLLVFCLRCVAIASPVLLTLFRLRSASPQTHGREKKLGQNSTCKTEKPLGFPSIPRNSIHQILLGSRSASAPSSPLSMWRQGQEQRPRKWQIFWRGGIEKAYMEMIFLDDLVIHLDILASSVPQLKKVCLEWDGNATWLELGSGLWAKWHLFFFCIV